MERTKKDQNKGRFEYRKHKEKTQKERNKENMKQKERTKKERKTGRKND